MMQHYLEDGLKKCVYYIRWKVGYQYPLGDKKTIHSEPNMPMSNPIQLDIVFDQNPTLDTLKKHGWVTEIGEQRPVVAQLPYDTPKLQRYSRIIIPPVGTVVDARIYEVTAISTILEYPDCWTVRLAPVYRTIEEENIELKDGNFSLIDVEKDGTHDEPNKKPIDFANYDFPEGKIEESKVITESDHFTDRIGSNEDNEDDKIDLSNNILGKDFNDFDE